MENAESRIIKWRQKNTNIMNCSKNHTTKSTCSSKKSISPVKSLKDLLDEYQNTSHLHKDWDKCRSIPEAVFGDTSYTPGNPPMPDVLPDAQWNDFLGQVMINPHQARYYTKDELHKIAEHLAAHWNRKTFKDFEDLYEYVGSILVKTAANPSGLVKNPYALIIYDIALRLAYRHGVWPKKYVYLNGSGPFKAANILGLGKFIRKRKILYIDVIKKYPELGKLDAAELEDFLCIHRKQIEELKNKGLL